MISFLFLLFLLGILYLLCKEFLKEGGIPAVMCAMGFHEFEAWKYVDENSCRQHKACTRCGKSWPGSEYRVEHSWVHVILNDTSCEKQEICSRCKEIRGKITVEHTWQHSFIGKNTNKKQKVCRRCSIRTDLETSQTKWAWILKPGKKRDTLLALQYASHELSLAEDMFAISSNARDKQVRVVSQTLSGTNLTCRGFSVSGASLMFYPEGIYQAVKYRALLQTEEGHSKPVYVDSSLVAYQIPAEVSSFAAKFRIRCKIISRERVEIPVQLQP